MAFWKELDPYLLVFFPLIPSSHYKQNDIKNLSISFCILNTPHHTHTHPSKKCFNDLLQPYKNKIPFEQRQSHFLVPYPYLPPSIIPLYSIPVYSSQNSLLPVLHFFHILICSSFTPVISSALKIFFVLPHPVDSYSLFKFQLSYDLFSYHFFIWLLWLVKFLIICLYHHKPLLLSTSQSQVLTFDFEIIWLIGLSKFLSSNGAKIMSLFCVSTLPWTWQGFVEWMNVISTRW